MPGLGATPANQILDALGNTAPSVNYLTAVNLNSADPGTTGASESATRQACSWNAAASRAKTNSSALTFAPTVPATPNTHFSTWSLTSGGVFGISGALGSSVTAASVTVAAGALSIAA